MDWIKIKNKNNAIAELPKDKVFLALWKGTICITEFYEEERAFYICMMPAQMSGIMRVDQEREGKFTHWCELNIPEDY